MAVKSTYRSFRWPPFSSVHHYGLTVTCNPSARKSGAPSVLQWAPAKACTSLHTYASTHNYKESKFLEEYILIANHAGSSSMFLWSQCPPQDKVQGAEMTDVLILFKGNNTYAWKPPTALGCCSPKDRFLITGLK